MSGPVEKCLRDSKLDWPWISFSKWMALRCRADRSCLSLYTRSWILGKLQVTGLDVAICRDTGRASWWILVTVFVAGILTNP